MTAKVLGPALVASLALVAGCSGAEAPSVSSGTTLTGYPLGRASGAPAPSKRVATPFQHAPRGLGNAPKGSALLYVSDSPASTIYIFKQGGANQSPIGSITSGLNRPAGMTVDQNGNLYVANESPTGSKYTVDVFAPGQSTPATVYDTDLSSPTDVAVDKHGTVYISNFNELSNGWVAVYPNGDATKEYRLSDFSGGAPLTLTLDKKNDLYVMYDLNATGSSAVNEYQPGAKTGTNLNLDFHWGGGIQVDRKGNIVLAQQLQPSVIYVFPPGATQPIKSIDLPNDDSPFEIALNNRGRALFAADDTIMDRLAYPSGKFKYTVAGEFEEAAGVAVSPAQFKPKR